nr:MAG: Abi-like protein [Candidatus Kentron sp. MB]VFK33786.1 MAG: Abi-like protein [Candidatus Kentron sp. MB]
MVVNDRPSAYHYLSHLNYYRLVPYWLPFQTDRVTHQFEQETTFDKVVSIYMFDKKLRLLILDAIDRVEVSIRTQFAYYFAHKYGAHAYLDKKYYVKEDEFSKDLDKFRHGFSISKEVFIAHYKNTYTEPEMPPIWAACEIMSLGLLSKLYSNLESKDIRQAISNTYDLDHMVMASFLHHLTYVRNLCAHHSRIWDREFKIKMKIPKSRPILLVESSSEATPQTNEP